MPVGVLGSSPATIATVDASGVVARQRDPLETRIHACGFDATSTTASSFQRACIRMLAADLNDTDVVTILDSCLLAPSPDAALNTFERLATAAERAGGLAEAREVHSSVLQPLAGIDILDEHALGPYPVRPVLDRDQ